MPLGRKQGFSGAAVMTQLTEGMDDSELEMNVASVEGWPSSGTPFTVTVDQGDETLQETVLVDSYIGTVVTLDSELGRGYDGTSAQAHAMSAPVVHTLDAAFCADVSTRLFSVSTEGDIAYVAETDGVVMAALGISDTIYEVIGAGEDGVPAYQQSAKSVLTTEGDILYASDANTLARLGVGDSGQVLTVADGLPSWQDSDESVIENAGDLIVGTGAGTVTNLPVGGADSVLVGGDTPSYAAGTDGQVMTIVDSVAEFATPAPPGGVLASGLIEGDNSGLMPTSLAAVNAGVCCTPTFTVPESGKVVVIVSGGYLEFIDDAPLYYAYMQLLSEGDSPAGNLVMVAGGGYDSASTNLSSPMVNVTFLVSGLTPGDSIYLDIGAYASEADAVSWQFANPASVPATPVTVVVLAA